MAMTPLTPNPITPLPTAPSRVVPSTFSALMDPFLSAMVTLATQINTLVSALITFITEANALETAVDNDAIQTAADRVQTGLDRSAAAASAASAVLSPGTSATSTTSLTIGIGSKSMTIQTGKDIAIGMSVKIAETTTGTNWMFGDVVSYNSGTGALVVNVTDINGSGTISAWTVSLSGPALNITSSLKKYGLI